MHYLELVTPDVDAVVNLYTHAHALTFGAAEPALGNARVATRPDGSLVGVRAPLATHEQPIARTYLSVTDIHAAAKAAEAAGAVIAYPPTAQGTWGTFAIVLHGGVQHGLWQR